MDLRELNFSAEGLNSAIESAGDKIAWRGDRGAFSHCPVCHWSGKRHKCSAGRARGRWMFYCHRCNATGDAAGYRAAVLWGATDTTNLSREQWAELSAFFRRAGAAQPTARRVVRNRRTWAQALLRRANLFSPDQILVVAAAAATTLPDSAGRFLDEAERGAAEHLRDSLRRRVRRWDEAGVFAAIDKAGDDAQRWETMRKAVMRSRADGKFALSAGARFFAICAYWSVARATPALAVMAGQAGVSVMTARRWWNFWVASGVFSGAIFVPRRPARITAQLKLSMPDAAPVAISRRRPRRRLFRRETMWAGWLAALVATGAAARGIARPPPLKRSLR